MTVEGENMTVLPPCKGCQDRTTGPDRRPCQPTCEKYQAFRAAQVKETEARNKYWKAHCDAKVGARRRWETPQSAAHGTIKERHRENGQKWPGERV